MKHPIMFLGAAHAGLVSQTGGGPFSDPFGSFLDGFGSFLDGFGFICPSLLDNSFFSSSNIKFQLAKAGAGSPTRAVCLPNPLAAELSSPSPGELKFEFRNLSEKQKDKRTKKNQPNGN